MNIIDLSGAWSAAWAGRTDPVTLPGTLDENGLGFPDSLAHAWHPDEGANAALAGSGPIATRFTRKHTYEGPAVYSRTLGIAPPEGRVFLEVERSRHLTLRVNGRDVPHFFPGTVSTPHVFEVTGMLAGCDLIELTCDNAYPGWPAQDILYSSAATDETQTNWNGLLGYLRLRVEPHTFIAALRVYPHGDALDVLVEVSSHTPWNGTIELDCPALDGTVCEFACGDAGITGVWLRDLPMVEGVRRWDEDEGKLYTMQATLGESSVIASFGVRDFAAKDGRLTLNGRRIFLRSEANCAVFPETGHPPMDVRAWLKILETYKSYGVNCMRFHSHCPPEAAFSAADVLGMMMQPELSHWNPRDAFSTEESRAYYRDELTQILAMLANHPSFVMLSLGNELQADDAGHANMADLLDDARKIDPTRLYAWGSNNHYGALGCDAASDFYTSSDVGKLPLRATNAGMRGWLNNTPPNFTTTYDAAVAELRRTGDQPVFSFEVGQYEILPDFDEIDAFNGVTDPANFRLIRDKAERAGVLARWTQRVNETGELALICYRAEVEAALRTEGMSGISLLGLQDFPGQGTALVGMLDSHLAAKPFDFAKPERFAAFFTGVMPLALLPRMTYNDGETLTASVRMANYGKETLVGSLEWMLEGESEMLGGALARCTVSAGGLTDVGELRVPLHVKKAERLTLTLNFFGHTNVYSVWVYPKQTVVCPDAVYECRTLDDTALAVLSSGGVVYLAPDSTKEALPNSIKSQFSTDFWSVGTFPSQDGGMGLYIDRHHPIFKDFPTAKHADYQWWHMASQRALILPRYMDAIVAVNDSYAYLRPLAMLLECRCNGGRLMISTMGLHNLDCPEARALQTAIYCYMASDAFAPAQEIDADEVRGWVR